MAGQVARDDAGSTVGVGDIVAQTEQVICNLRLALQSVDAGLRHIVKVTIFTTDIRLAPEIIRLAVMIYVRFPLSLRQVEDLLYERGIARLR